MITRASFVDGLLAEVPEAGPTVAEHLEDNYGELLLHLLMSDLQRLSVGTFAEGHRGVT